MLSKIFTNLNHFVTFILYNEYQQVPSKKKVNVTIMENKLSYNTLRVFNLIETRGCMLL